MNQKPKTCSTGSMFTYSLGECANSLVMNGIFGFAMQTPSLPGADPRSDRPRCGGRESKFLAAGRESKFLAASNS